MKNTRNISFSPPDLSEDEIGRVAEVLRSGWITTGPRTKELETKIASLCHTEKAVCLNSATACMESILRLLGVGQGDEIITTAYTYTATASVAIHVGATLKIIDTMPDSFEMDYDKMEAAITERTKVIVPVDLGGVVCHYDRIFEAVNNKQHLFKPSNEIQKAIGRVVVMSDAAHALGATRDGKMCGEIADFTSFSFHAVKNFTTAEGGALTWRNIQGIGNEDIYKQFMLLSLHGQSKDALAKTQMGAWEYDIVAPLYKCNMTDIMAAIGLGQFERYSSMLQRRREIITMYNKAFEKLPIQTLPHYTSTSASSGHLYIMRMLGRDTDFRNSVIKQMAERGIACNVHYKPLPLLTAYKNLGFDIKDYPNAYHLYANEITLPLHTLLTNEDVQYITENLIDILAHDTI